MFVAVSVPAPVADAVEAAIEPWRSTFPTARWVPRENWHVTLRFLGWTSPRLVPWLRDRLSEVADVSTRVECRVRRLGAFPTTGRARVLWAGLEDADGGLAAIAHGVQDSLVREFPPERRPFSAHLTVARSDPPLRLPDDFAQTLVEGEPFSIEELVLMRSHLRRPSPLYEPVGVFPLMGDDPPGSG